MEVFESAFRMNSWSSEKSCSGLSVSLVPTMGALHRAHGELIRRAVAENDLTVVSIFVNPTQFGPAEDFKAYPRDFESDRELCEKEGVDVLFSPKISEMYPNGAESGTEVSVKEISSFMCGAHRPGHFDGVATVVAKLFNVVRPSRAYFGLKDYQQFQIIKRLNSDLIFGIEIVGCYTVRESDGLALSSRNRYLDKQQRRQVPYIYKALLKAAEQIKNGETDGTKISFFLKEFINKHIDGCKIDYAGAYHAQRLHPLKKVEGEVVLAAAVWVGRARLIDNLAVQKK